LINIEDSPFYLENKLTGDIPSLMELFEEALFEIVRSAYNKDELFEHDISSKFCSYCEG